MTSPVLEITGLCVDYVTPGGLVRAVDDVSLRMGQGEMLGLVGESGCGKSTLARAALRVLGPPAVITRGSVQLAGQEILKTDINGLNRIRWRRASIVVQGALDALNPVLQIEDQLTDALVAHGEPPQKAKERALELLDLVALPRHIIDAYPHQLSGGMRQRVVIAMALAFKPDLVVMDEPTTALDVVVQAEIMDEIDRLRRALGFAVLLVSHDLPLILERCDQIAVMYAGRIVESAPTDVFRHGASHPYAKHLLDSFPRVDGPRTFAKSLPGAPPRMDLPPSGCRFHPRCPSASAVCAQAMPPLVSIGQRHMAACHLTPAGFVDQPRNQSA